MYDFAESESRKGQNCLELMEKYPKAKVCKSKPESRNSNVNVISVLEEIIANLACLLTFESRGAKSDSPSEV